MTFEQSLYHLIAHGVALLGFAAIILLIVSAVYSTARIFYWTWRLFKC